MTTEQRELYDPSPKAGAAEGHLRQVELHQSLCHFTLSLDIFSL